MKYTPMGIRVNIQRAAGPAVGDNVATRRARMLLVFWSALLVGAVFFGVGVVAWFVVPRQWEAPAFVVTAFGLGGSAYAVVQAAVVTRRVEIVLASIVIGVAGSIGGYGLAAALLPLIAGSRQPPPTLPSAPRGRGTRVFLLTSAEPERYSVSATAAELNYLQEDGESPAPVAVLPFFFAAQKSRYRAAGGRSPARADTTRIADTLASVLSKEGVESVLAVFCGGAKSLAEHVAEAVAEGCGRIIVVPVGVTTDQSCDIEASRLADMRPEAHDVDVAFTPSLWGSMELANMLADRVHRAVSLGSDGGAALVIHGQPPSEERSHSSYGADELAFAHRVRLLLIDRGLPEELVRISYSEWRDPSVNEAVRHLAALGCERIVVCPVSFPTETLYTLLDLRHAVDQARVNVSVTILAAWGAETPVIEALAHAVRTTASEMDEVRAE